MNIDIKAVIGPDGEEYLNGKDLIIAMKKLAMNGAAPSVSVLNFVKMIAINLITARRGQ